VISESILEEYNLVPDTNNINVKELDK